MNLTYLEIDRNRSSYEALSGPVRDAFMDRLMMSWLYHDHALDGVVLSEEDLHRALTGQPARNYVDGQIHKSLCRLRRAALDLFEEKTRRQELSVDFIRDLHIRMSDPGSEKAGRYRQRDTSPGVYNLKVVGQNSISYYFHKFIDTYHDELVNFHPIRAAAMAHWEFMRVFPFDEKTGMVGRLMMNFLLIKHNYPPAIVHAIDRDAYFQALDGQRADLVPVIAAAMSSTIEAAEAFSQQYIESSTHQLAL